MASVDDLGVRAAGPREIDREANFLHGFGVTARCVGAPFSRCVFAQHDRRKNASGDRRSRDPDRGVRGRHARFQKPDAVPEGGWNVGRGRARGRFRTP
jgi:hypothetical protein